jgi:hypothetical protein
MACSPGLVLPRKVPLFVFAPANCSPLWLDAYLKLDQKKEDGEICMLFVSFALRRWTPLRCIWACTFATPQRFALFFFKKKLKLKGLGC